jgi:hypothetical protein
VEEPGSTTRVEIELTPHEESRLRRRKAESAGAVVVDDDGIDLPVVSPELESQLPALETPPSDDERRKLIAVATVVAVVALFVGWSLGRAGRSAPSDAAQSPATTAGASPSETPPLAVVPSTAPATVPATSRPRAPVGPATTTVPEWQTETVEVHPALAALAIDVVTIGGTRINELDATTGELRTLTMSSGISQPPVIDAGTDWFVIRNFDSGVAQLVRDGELPAAVPILDVWSSHFQADTGMFLQAAREYDPGAPLGVVEVDHEGNRTGRRFDIPGGVWPAAPDPAGGVVVSAAGGTYHAGVEGSQRLTTGNLVALSKRVALETDCGEAFSDCGMFVVDRASGARTQVQPIDDESAPIDILDVQSPAFWSSPELMGAISPDDRWAPIVLSNNQQQFGLVDLTTGQFTKLAANPPSGLWWSPDGRFAIYNESSRLMLFDTQQLTTTDIAPQGMLVDAFAVRPAAPAA